MKRYFKCKLCKKELKHRCPQHGVISKQRVDAYLRNIQKNQVFLFWGGFLFALGLSFIAVAIMTGLRIHL